MRRALPAIAVSAAGLTWLLHAQGIIDTTTTSGTAGTAGAGTAGAGAATAPADRSTSPTTTTKRPEARNTPTTSTPSTPSTTRGAGTAGGTPTDGPVVDTRFGPVQVEAVIAGNKLTSVTFLQYPDDARRSQQINNRAMPTLVQESLSAQSAEVDTVSGATYTSEAYTQSLQAALDQAGFKH